MEENSRRWLALREASRRILVEDNLDVFVPQSEVAVESSGVEYGRFNAAKGWNSQKSR